MKKKDGQKDKETKRQRDKETERQRMLGDDDERQSQRNKQTFKEDRETEKEGA